MKHVALLAITVIAVLGARATAAQSAEVAPVVFDTQVRVDVGPDGKVADVVPDRRFPDVIDAAVRNHVRAWTFEPPRQNGVPVAGTTYAQLRGCAVSAGGGLSVAFEPARTGPGDGEQGINGVHHLQIPLSLFDLGAFEVRAVYRVNADGSVAVESVTSDGRRNRDMRVFERTIGTWLASRRLLPEVIDGRVVATRMSLPIQYAFSRVERRASPAPAALAAERPSCQAATAGNGESRHPVALDSAFRLRPAG